jgi:uncharacterized membrane protein YcaP (DUF421 family)
VGSAAVRTAAVYLLTIGLVRVAGRRTLAQMSAFDAIVTIGLGTLAASTALPSSPALSDFVVVLLTFLALQAMIASAATALHTAGALARLRARGPLRAREPELRGAPGRAQVTQSQLESRLRRKGVGSLEQATLVVLEPTGQVTVNTADEIPPLFARSQRALIPVAVSRRTTSCAAVRVIQQTARWRGARRCATMPPIARSGLSGWVGAHQVRDIRGRSPTAAVQARATSSPGAHRPPGARAARLPRRRRHTQPHPRPAAARGLADLEPAADEHRPSRMTRTPRPSWPDACPSTPTPSSQTSSVTSSRLRVASTSSSAESRAPRTSLRSSAGRRAATRLSCRASAVSDCPSSSCSSRANRRRSPSCADRARRRSRAAPPRGAQHVFVRGAQHRHLRLGPDGLHPLPRTQGIDRPHDARQAGERRDGAAQQSSRLQRSLSSRVPLTLLASPSRTSA